MEAIKKMDLLCILEFSGETKSTSWNAESGLMLLGARGEKSSYGLGSFGYCGLSLYQELALVKLVNS